MQELGWIAYHRKKTKVANDMDNRTEDRLAVRFWTEARRVVAGTLVLCTLAAAAGEAADIFAGQAIYEVHCANCHGFDGRPLIPGSPDFTRGEGLLNPDAVLIDTIRSGRNLMPAFNRIISEQEMLNVLDYVRTLYR